jgi:hypothetical protein
LIRPPDDEIDVRIVGYRELLLEKTVLLQPPPGARFRLNMFAQ